MKQTSIPSFPNIKRLGRNMALTLEFAMKYPGWHSYKMDRATENAVKRLAARNLVEINEFQQFRLSK